jgi:beta-fructofuranosidase
MLVGGTRADGTAAAFVYRSTDLLRWHSTGPLAERSGSEALPVWTGTMWECVQLLSVDDEHLLVVSVYDQGVPHYVACAVGTYHDGAFLPKNWFRLTYGPAVYAASAYRDDQGRPGLIGWLRGVADPAGRWTGAITIPTLLDLDEHHRPLLRPHPNILRRRAANSGDGVGNPRTARWPAGAAVDVEWSPHSGRATSLGILDEHDVTLAEVRVADDTLTLIPGQADAAASTMPWPGGGVRLLLDGPVLEIFCGGALMGAPVNPLHQQLSASHDTGGTYRYWVLAPD